MGSDPGEYLDLVYVPEASWWEAKSAQDLRKVWEPAQRVLKVECKGGGVW